MLRYPAIHIDESRCTVPFDCKRCLQVCPQAVFAVEAVKVERGRETDPKEPGAYKLDTPYRDKCVMCHDCIEACPVSALTITLAEEVKS